MALSKLDRMSFVENDMGDIDLVGLVDSLREVADAAERAEEARSEAEGAAAEAVSAHEDRDWDTRNDALQTCNDQVGELEEALDVLNSSPYLTGEVERFNAAVTKVQDAKTHLDHLIEV